MSSAPTSGPRAPPPPYAIASPALRPPPCRRTHPFRSRAAIQEWTTRSEQTWVIPGERQSPRREAAWGPYSRQCRTSSRKAIRAFAAFSRSTYREASSGHTLQLLFSGPVSIQAREVTVARRDDNSVVVLQMVVSVCFGWRRRPDSNRGSGICTSMPVLLRQSSVRPAMHRGFIDRTDDLRWIGTGSAHRSLGGSGRGQMRAGYNGFRIDHLCYIPP